MIILCKVSHITMWKYFTTSKSPALKSLLKAALINIFVLRMGQMAMHDVKGVARGD